MEHKNAYQFIKTVAEMKNMSKAAAALNVSQPAISAQIKKVETFYNIEIFDRSVKPLALTEAGKAYLNYCRQEARLEQNFIRHISDMTNLETGELTVGGATLFNSTYLPEAVYAFSKKYPGINLHITDRPVPELTRLVLAGDIDLFFTPSIPDTTELSYRKVKENRLILVVPSEWEINAELKRYQLTEKEIYTQDFKRPQVDMSSFNGLPVIFLSESQNVGIIFRKLFQDSGSEPGQIITADQILTSYSLSAAGAGMSLAPSPIVKAHGRKKLTYYLVGHEECRRQLYVCWSKQESLSAAGKAFTDLLAETLENEQVTLGSIKPRQANLHSTH